MVYISADPSLVLAYAGRRLGSPQVCDIGRGLATSVANRVCCLQLPSLPRLLLPHSWPRLSPKPLQLPPTWPRLLANGVCMAFWRCPLAFSWPGLLPNGVSDSMSFRNCQMASVTRAWKTTLQLPPFAAPAFATFLAMPVAQASPASTLCPFAGRVCCQMVFLCRFETARWHLSPGPEKQPCSFHPLPHLLLPRSWPCLSHKPLQLPPFALLLAASVAKWCFYVVSKLPDGICHQGLKNPCSFHPLPHLLLQLSWPCLSPKPLQLPPFVANWISISSMATALLIS